MGGVQTPSAERRNQGITKTGSWEHAVFLIKNADFLRKKDKKGMSLEYFKKNIMYVKICVAKIRALVQV